MIDYSTKLKDPRWQKKRLKILSRDEWTCRYCYDTESPLVVHHKLYLPKLEPWEYPNDLLITICEDCHRIEREERLFQEQRLLNELKKYFSSPDIQGIANCLDGFKLLHSHEVVANAYGDALQYPKLQQYLIDNLFISIIHKQLDGIDA